MEKLSQELSKIRTALANLDTDIKKVKILRNQETESNLSMFEII
nr:MAG TPA: pinin/SDK conserved region [Caudoviricetes sp.]